MKMGYPVDESTVGHKRKRTEEDFGSTPDSHRSKRTSRRHLGDLILPTLGNPLRDQNRTLPVPFSDTDSEFDGSMEDGKWEDYAAHSCSGVEEDSNNTELPDAPLVFPLNSAPTFDSNQPDLVFGTACPIYFSSNDFLQTSGRTLPRSDGMDVQANGQLILGELSSGDSDPKTNTERYDDIWPGTEESVERFEWETPASHRPDPLAREIKILLDQLEEVKHDSSRALGESGWPGTHDSFSLWTPEPVRWMKATDLSTRHLTILSELGMWERNLEHDPGVIHSKHEVGRSGRSSSVMFQPATFLEFNPIIDEDARSGCSGSNTVRPGQKVTSHDAINTMKCANEVDSEGSDTGTVIFDNGPSSGGMQDTEDKEDPVTEATDIDEHYHYFDNSLGVRSDWTEQVPASGEDTREWRVLPVSLRSKIKTVEGEHKDSGDIEELLAGFEGFHMKDGFKGLGGQFH